MQAEAVITASLNMMKDDRGNGESLPQITYISRVVEMNLPATDAPNTLGLNGFA